MMRYERLCGWLLDSFCTSWVSGGFWGGQYFEATQMGSLSAMVKSICSLVCLFFTLSPCQRDFQVSVSKPRLTDSNILRLCCLKSLPFYKRLPWKLKNMAVKRFLIMSLVAFLVSSALFWLFLSFVSSFFSNSERLLTKQMLYLLLNLCVCDHPKVWSSFACCVVLDNQFVSTGFVMNMCDIKY